jgi:hypothetical protein
MGDIEVRIPVELTAAMVIRAGVITDEARVLELAHELHAIIAKFVELRRAEKRRLAEHPKGPDGEDNPDAEPVVPEEARGPDALEIADFTLAAWRQALASTVGLTDDAPDCHEAGWISEELATITPLEDADDLFLRWIMIGDAVTGSKCAADIMAIQGKGVQ